MDNHYYKLGTSKCFFYISKLVLIVFLVLHPSLRAEWFRNLAPKFDEGAHQEAVDKAATLFHHVATTYHKNSPPEADTDSTSAAAGSAPSPSKNDGGFLASMLQVEVANITPNTNETPEEKFADEVRRYLRFEGGRGEIMNPLGWWKVLPSVFFS